MQEESEVCMNECINKDVYNISCYYILLINITCVVAYPMLEIDTIHLDGDGGKIGHQKFTR